MVTDVLIIGGGLAGLRAAQVCFNSGLDVTVICNGKGASPFVHGLSVPLSKDDSPKLFFDDTLKSGYFHNDKKLAKTLCDKSLLLLDEFEFDKNGDDYDLLKALGSSVPRVAFIKKNSGASVISDIEKNCKVNKLTNVRAYRLIKSNGRVCGARCFDISKKIHFTIYSKAVVLACGGFGGIFPFSTNSHDISGDGIAMAYDVGATLKDLEFIQFEPSVAVSPESLVGKSVITTMLYEGAVIKNKFNCRFMDERQDKDSLSFGIYKEIQKGLGTSNGGVYYDMTAVDKTLLTTKYANYFNRYKQVGIDISTTPVEIAPAPHTTMGGVKIDEYCKTTIDGLFACGEVTGGLHGANRLGGNAGLEVLVFGKIAGESCVKYLESFKGENYLDDEIIDDIFVDTTDIGATAKQLAYESLNVVRNTKTMQDALIKCNNILSSLSTDKIENSFNLIKVRNIVLTIKLTLESCLLRSYSVGSCKIDGLEEFCKDKHNAYSVNLRRIDDETVFSKELL